MIPFLALLIEAIVLQRCARNSERVCRASQCSRKTVTSTRIQMPHPTSVAHTPVEEIPRPVVANRNFSHSPTKTQFPESWTWRGLHCRPETSPTPRKREPSTR